MAFTGKGSRFDDNKSLRPGVIVGQGDVNHRFVPGWRHCFQTLGRPAGDMHYRLARVQIGNCHVFPGDSHPQTSAQSFGTSLFGGPAFGISARNVQAALCFTLLSFGEDPVAEAIAKPIQRTLNTFDIGQIGSNPENHISAAGLVHQAAHLGNRRSQAAKNCLANQKVTDIKLAHLGKGSNRLYAVIGEPVPRVNFQP